MIHQEDGGCGCGSGDCGDSGHDTSGPDSD